MQPQLKRTGPDTSGRKKASEFPQELLDIFDLYVHGDIDRRGFLDRAKKFAVGGLTAAALLESLTPNFAWAQQVPESDSRVKTQHLTIPSPNGNGEVECYLAKPASGNGPWPAILVVHENRGRNPYIEDVARRLATEGYLALAPDGLTSVGGYPGDEDQGRALFREVDRNKMGQDFVAAARWLKQNPQSTGKLGAVGFCFGGGVVNNLAVELGDELDAGVPFYGAQVSDADAMKITAPLMLQYAELDTRLTGGWPAYEKALQAAGVEYQAYIYEGANHGFHNDTTPRYDEEAAKLAWSRTLEFFNEHLKA